MDVQSDICGLFCFVYFFNEFPIPTIENRLYLC